MPTSHTIVRGEHLALVAFRAGFGDVQPVLDHPDNSTFAGRPHPTILDVGEALTIPDLTAKQISLATGQRHKLVIQRIKTKLEVVFKTFRGGDTSATTAALSVGDAPARSVSLDAGKMELPIEAAAVNADAADLTRLVSFEPIPMAAAAPEPASGPDAQTLVRYELGFRRGDVSVELNAHDGQPLSWLFARLAEGDGPPSAPAAMLATATAAADPLADAVLTQSGYEELGGKPVFVAHWEHHHEGVVVERDYIRVLVSGGSGRVFAVHRRWHAVDFNPTAR